MFKPALLTGTALMALLLATGPAMAGGSGGTGGGSNTDTTSVANGGAGSDGTSTNSNGASGGASNGVVGSGTGGAPGTSGATGGVDQGGGGGGGNNGSTTRGSGGSGNGTGGAGGAGGTVSLGNGSGSDGSGGSGGGGGGGGDAVIMASDRSLTTLILGRSGASGGGETTASGFHGGGGGGGGAGIVSDGASHTLDLQSGGVTAGNGGNGGSSTGGNGGGGGGGGAGIGASSLTITNGSGLTVQGGVGGAGGAGSNIGGNGGNGGSGIVGNNSTITNNGTIQGANGGNGGTGTNGRGGDGGDAGSGIFGNNLTITNNGTIRGGQGGNGGNNSTNQGGDGGDGGNAIVGQNLNITNNGTLTSGFNGSPIAVGGSTGAVGMAVRFTGGTNTLTLLGGSSISGRVDATAGTNDTFALGGTTGTTASPNDFSVNNLGNAVSGQYRGFETFTKTGTGVWRLTGTDSIGHAWTISAGTLLINGSNALSAFTIQNGGTLGGTNTIGATTVQSGGTHAPGNSIGTQTISGNYALNSGGTLLIEVDSTTADKLIVNGTVTLGGTLRIVGLPGNSLSADESYTHTIIENDGADAVTGTFGTINNQLAFYSQSVDYAGGTGNDVVLTLTRNQTSHTDVARTPNQSAVAGVLDQMSGSDGTTVKNTVLGLTSDGAARAYEQLSGDAYASINDTKDQVIRQTSSQIDGRMAALGSSRSGSNAALVAASSLSPAALAGFAQAGPASSDPLAYDTDAPMLAIGSFTGAKTGAAVWAQVIGGKGRIDGDGNADDTDYKWAGAIGGYDIRISENTVFGVYLGYANGENRQTNRDATLDSANLMAGVYGTHDLGDNWRLSGQAGWSRVAIDSNRKLNFGGIDRTATADYADHAVNTDIEIARGFDIAPSWRVEPYGGLGLLWNHQSSFTETGADAANITRKSDDDISGTASLGLRMAGMFETGNGKTLIPQFRLGWDHHLGPITNSTTLSFAGTPSFTVSGTDRDRDTLVGNLGFVLADDAGWSLYTDYQPSVSENRTEHALGAGFRLEF